MRDISERQRSERALRVSESRLEAIVAHTPAVVYVKSADDFTFVLVNREFEELFGLEAGDALGKTDEAILGPDAARSVHANDLEVLEAGRPMVREEVVPAYGGENRTYLSVKFPCPMPRAGPTRSAASQPTSRHASETTSSWRAVGRSWPSPSAWQRSAAGNGG